MIKIEHLNKSFSDNHVLKDISIEYRKGVCNMEFLISLIIAVMAGVISHLICKWLDSDKKDR